MISKKENARRQLASYRSILDDLRTKPSTPFWRELAEKIKAAIEQLEKEL